MYTLRIRRAPVLSPNFLRTKEKSTAKKLQNEPIRKKRYTGTVLLSQTDFPARLGGKKRVEMDSYLTEKCRFAQLYDWQRQNLSGPEFVLHDGPPYANGIPHMGHAINKILKDITLRRKIVQGTRVHYVPGWDCHGLPIELKALKGLSDRSPLEIRSKAREYAERAITGQRRAFESWGIVANWADSGCYFTNRSSYVTNQLNKFIDLYEKGLVFRDFKPVYWSPSSKTALAESELEYNKSHKSKCAIIRFRINNLPTRLRTFENRKMYALAWTTTPWTLVANRALAYGSDVTYSIVEDSDGNLNIVAEALAKIVESKIGSLRPVATVKGNELDGATYFHPIGREDLPFVSGQHVTTDLGTGLVHIAPAHGPEDFLVALENNVEVVSLVDTDGRYTEEAGPLFHGLDVLSQGNEAVMERIGKDVLHVETLTHSYPYDWRTKKPVIIRASHQWFVDIKSIKQRAIDSVSDVKIYPECNRASFVNALHAQISQRPYWCISRQRSWGTPIPVLRNRKMDKVFTSRKLVERLCRTIDRYGPDCWWELSIEKLIGLDVIEELNVEASDVEKGTDIMDIWFDSGISWSAVLPEGKADLYLEGSDQFTGWFQSSLLTSVALRGCSPYRALFVHGFAVDENASKMSKSQGNVVNPDEILKGSESGKTPAYGVDTLRWWVANHGCQHAQIPVTRDLLDQCGQSVQKLRATLRFLLGILRPYDSNEACDHVRPLYRTLDKYMLHSLYQFDKRIEVHYNSYEYHHACKTIMHFVTNDVSALYCHVAKDRVYCDEAASPSRVAVIRVAREILTVLLRTIAPILPHLVEEAWLHHPDNIESIPFHCTKYEVPSDNWNDPNIAECINKVLRAKARLNKIIDTNTWEFSVKLAATKDDFSAFSILQRDQQSATSELCEILQVSSIVLSEDEAASETRIEATIIGKELCERCRRHPALREDGLCERLQDKLDRNESLSWRGLQNRQQISLRFCQREPPSSDEFAKNGNCP